jgi:hypothetical protein
VDNGVHPADLVYLIGESSGLGCAGQIADDNSSGVPCQVAEHRRPLASARVEDNVMAFTHQESSGGAAESVGRAGDEDTGHGTILPSVVCDRLDASFSDGLAQRNRDNWIWPELRHY